MRAARIGNSVLGLVTELAQLVALVVVGLRSGAPAPAPIAIAVLLPAIVIAVRAVLIAPRAPRRLRPAALLVLEAAMHGLTAALLAAAALPGAAVGYAAAVAVHLVLRVRLGQV